MIHIEYKHDHVVVYMNREFYFTADTVEEAHEELRKLGFKEF